ncbi:MAG: hypothetical protein M1826_000664 [Phylliscum demangeonii]|nr:MAG: hypothetical protein M1826_000664 [Phylliscum demangeonii]
MAKDTLIGLPLLGNDILQPHSLPNFAGFGLVQQNLAGEERTVDFAYPGSTLKSFDLQALYYYSCLLNLQGSASTGATVGSKLFNFSPPSVAGTGFALQASMAFAAFTDLTVLSKRTARA